MTGALPKPTIKRSVRKSAVRGPADGGQWWSCTVPGLQHGGSEMTGYAPTPAMAYACWLEEYPKWKAQKWDIEGDMR